MSGCTFPFVPRFWLGRSGVGGRFHCGSIAIGIRRPNRLRPGRRFCQTHSSRQCYGEEAMRFPPDEGIVDVHHHFPVVTLEVADYHLLDANSHFLNKQGFPPSPSLKHLQFLPQFLFEVFWRE